MKLVVYGSLRRGEDLAYAMPKGGKYSVIELSGIQLYVVGECPGAKLATRENKAVVELWEFDLTKKAEKRLLHHFDVIEGVYFGLYERNYIDTPKGKALIYTICGSVKSYPKIKDWKEWQSKNKTEKEHMFKPKNKSYISII